MTRAAFNRMLLLVHGQGDELETPKRRFIPGAWNYEGHAVRLQGYAHCTGDCHGGRRGCDCATGCVEMACDVAPDADRVIAPPPPLSDDMRARFKRRALYLSALGFGALAGLLEAFGAAPFDRINP